MICILCLVHLLFADHPVGDVIAETDTILLRVAGRKVISSVIIELASQRWELGDVADATLADAEAQSFSWTSSQTAGSMMLGDCHRGYELDGGCVPHKQDALGCSRYWSLQTAPGR
jgi:hypothetical protein